MRCLHVPPAALMCCCVDAHQDVLRDLHERPERLFAFLLTQHYKATTLPRRDDFVLCSKLYAQNNMVNAIMVAISSGVKDKLISTTADARHDANLAVIVQNQPTYKIASVDIDDASHAILVSVSDVRTSVTFEALIIHQGKLVEEERRTPP